MWNETKRKETKRSEMKRNEMKRNVSFSQTKPRAFPATGYRLRTADYKANRPGENIGEFRLVQVNQGNQREAASRLYVKQFQAVRGRTCDVQGTQEALHPSSFLLSLALHFAPPPCKFKRI